MNYAYIPKDKHDLDSCARLSKTTDEDVIAKLDELIEWTQDINWPVAIHVINRVKFLGTELAEPLVKILQSSDNTWKYFIIVHLLPHVKGEVLLLLQDEITRIISNPTDSEILEEVHLEAKELINESHV